MPRLFNYQQAFSDSDHAALLPPLSSGLHRSNNRSPNSPFAEPGWIEREPVVLGQDEGLLRVQWSNLLLMRWYGPSTRKRVEAAFGDMRAIADQLGGVVLLSILEVGTSPPDDEARKYVANSEKLLGSRLKASAYLPHSQGFLASTLMSLLVGLKRVHGSCNHPERVFKTEYDATAWLSDFIRKPVTTESLARAICAAKAIRRM